MTQKYFAVHNWLKIRKLENLSWQQSVRRTPPSERIFLILEEIVISQQSPSGFPYNHLPEASGSIFREYNLRC